MSSGWGPAAVAARAALEANHKLQSDTDLLTAAVQSGAVSGVNVTPSDAERGSMGGEPLPSGLLAAQTRPASDTSG